MILNTSYNKQLKNATSKEVICVPKFYLKWRPEPTAFPSKPEETFKLVCSMCEMTKADLKAGAIKDWGCAPGGWSGYVISEAPSETELNTILQKYVPYFHFEVTPVLTIYQFTESINKAVAKAKK
jgi:hypothetical protein